MAKLNGKDIMLIGCLLGGGGGSPIEVSTEAEMTALLVEENIGRIYRYTGETATYTQGSLYEVILGEGEGNLEFMLLSGGGGGGSSENKLALLVGTQDATNNPYEITASDLGDMTEIGAYVFYEKDGMTNIDLSNITKIGQKAFYGCNGLTEITIDNDVPPVYEAGWFTNCTNLKKVYAPKLTTIPSRFLESCTAIEELYCPEVTRIEGAYSMGGTSSKRSFAGKDLVFPKVTYVGQSAFSNCGARKISFPALVTGLESFPFYENPNLEEIDLPLLETAPTTYFVYKCQKVTKLVLPKLTKLDFGSIYYYNTKLSLIDLPSATTLTCARNQFSSGTPNIRLKLGYDGVVALNKASNAVFPNAITEVYVKPNYVEEYKIATNWVDWVAQGTVTIKSLDEFVE